MLPSQKTYCCPTDWGFGGFVWVWGFFWGVGLCCFSPQLGTCIRVGSRTGKMRPATTAVQDSCPFLTVFSCGKEFLNCFTNGSEWSQLKLALL